MNYIKFLIGGAAAAALSLCVVSCGGDDEEPKADDKTGPEWSDDEKGDGQTFATEEEAKEYLGETAQMAMRMLEPADQKPLIEVAGAFANDYADYDIIIPNGQQAPRNEGRTLKRFFSELRRATASGRYTDLSRAAQNVLELSTFTGTFEPDNSREAFVMTGRGSDLVVRFFHNGSRCELKVTPSSDTWTLDSAELTDSVFDAVKVPRNITFTLTEASRQLVNGTVRSNWADGSELLLSTDVTAMNIRVTAEINATNSTANTNYAVYVDGTELLTASGEVKGNKMVTLSAIQALEEEYTEKYYYGPGEYDYWEETYYEINPQKVTNMFRSGNAGAKLLGRAYVAAQVNDSKKFLELEDTYFEEDSDDPGEARKDCQKACSVLNSAIATKLYLAGNSKETATLKWQPLKYEENYSWGSYTSWECDPTLAFADGSTYSISDYGYADFSSVISSFENLAYAYERMFNALF